jgi:hypothetical protein
MRFDFKIVFFAIGFITCVTQVVAQESLRGKWTSSLLVVGKDTILTTNRYDKVTLVFGRRQQYVKCSYLYGQDSLRYHFLDRKVETKSGKAAKVVKQVEKGTYQIDNSRILFRTNSLSYEVSFSFVQGELVMRGQEAGKENTSLNYIMVLTHR